jgi:predicted membrane chloride channel (bestrophin family)
MRLLSYINEEYYKRVKDYSGKSHEIFLNPTKKEFRELSNNSYKEVRFVAFRDVLYAWSGDKALMHENFWDDDMNRDIYKDTEDGIVFPGYAKVSGSNIKLIEVATYLEEYLQDYENDKINEKRLIELEKKFKWLNRYVDTSPLRKILEDFWKKR